MRIVYAFRDLRSNFVINCQFVFILGTALRIYFGLLAVALTIFVLLVLACLLGEPRSKFRYYAKFIMVYYATLVGTTLLGPVFALRPRDVVNIQ